MSFGFSANSGALEWSGQSLSSVFAQKRNLLNPFFWRMLRDIFRFNKAAARDHEAGLSEDETLGEWLDRYGFSEIVPQSLSLAHGGRDLVDTSIRNRSVSGPQFSAFFLQSSPD
jgi:predicted NAD/FAD-binding protein